MISNNLKKRFITSLFLFLIIFSIFLSNLFFVYFLIVLMVFSILEFLDMTKKFIKKKINLIILNLIFIFYVFLFSLISVFFYGNDGSKLIIFFLLLCCVASDIGGFVFGKTFKGPKLTKISPNKTISGALGSLFLSCVTFFGLFFIFSMNFQFKFLLIALFTSLGCQLGDLFFSYLKRKSKIKDTGSILPGHGGILDRLDGILLGIPTGIFSIIYL